MLYILFSPGPPNILFVDFTSFNELQIFCYSTSPLELSSFNTVTAFSWTPLDCGYHSAVLPCRPCHHVQWPSPSLNLPRTDATTALSHPKLVDLYEREKKY